MSKTNKNLTLYFNYTILSLCFTISLKKKNNKKLLLNIKKIV